MESSHDALGSLTCFALLAAGAAAYCVPTVIAGLRGHHQIGPIIVINALLGWSLIGWAVALAMACSAVRPRQG